MHVNGISECPSGESCYSSTLDCSTPQQPQPGQSENVDQKPQSGQTQPEIVDEQSNNINNDGEDWGSSEGQQVHNDGEDWGSTSDVNNEGEDWGSTSGVNNEGEDWDQPKVPTNKPTPGMPTPTPTQEPTIDLESHLENLKNSYFCSETWDVIDCDNAQSCPSGDSKGKKAVFYCRLTFS